MTKVEKKKENEHWKEDEDVEDVEDVESDSHNETEAG